MQTSRLRLETMDDKQQIHSEMSSHGPPALSIIVPVLNEARLIFAFLRHLRAQAPAEIIVVDGGSEDGTVSLCEPLADQVICATGGRAAQMNAGAAVARAEILWFLHADSELPPRAIESIRRHLEDPGQAGGCFRLRFPRREWIYRVSDSLGNLGVDVFGFALGDHGIFCRRGSFEKVGGFPLVPILEDAELYRRLRRVGKMEQLRDAIVSSPRRYEMLGPYRTTAFYALILALYVAGLRIHTLHRLYRRLHRKNAGSRRKNAADETPVIHRA
ncbi:MAG: glycosyltransferase [Verrucomicrobia bacterium]|nr:MAG: glycosyltransferase [Verrucomicrobiota bacterium]